MEAFEQKQETLQLMKDMLNVNGDTSVLYDSKVDKQFEALRCTRWRRSEPGRGGSR